MLPDKRTGKGGNVGEEGILPDSRTITRAQISHCQSMFCQMAAIDGEEFTRGEVTTGKEGFHEELVINLLDTQIWRVLHQEGRIGVIQEGPNKLHPAVRQQEPILVKVGLEKGYGQAKFQLSLFHRALQEVAVH